MTTELTGRATADLIRQIIAAVSFGDFALSRRLGAQLVALCGGDPTPWEKPQWQ